MAAKAAPNKGPSGAIAIVALIGCIAALGASYAVKPIARVGHATPTSGASVPDDVTVPQLTDRLQMWDPVAINHTRKYG